MTSILPPWSFVVYSIFASLQITWLAKLSDAKYIHEAETRKCNFQFSTKQTIFHLTSGVHLDSWCYVMTHSAVSQVKGPEGPKDLCCYLCKGQDCRFPFILFLFLLAFALSYLFQFPFSNAAKNSLIPFADLCRHSITPYQYNCTTIIYLCSTFDLTFYSCATLKYFKQNHIHYIIL